MARKLPGLRRELDARSLFSVAYGEIASSIYFALGIVALHAVGFTPLVLLGVGLLFLVVALSYAEATSALPETGGAATFVRQVPNDLAGFMTGWALFLDYLIVIALSALFVPHYLAAALRVSALDRNPWDVVVGVGVIFAVAGIRLLRRPSFYAFAILVPALDVLTQLVLLGFGFALLFSPHALTHGTSLGHAPTLHSLAFAIPLAMLAFTGLETVANLAEEARRPGVDLPRSLFLAIATVITVYVGIAVVALSAFPGPTTELGTRWLRSPLVGVAQQIRTQVPLGLGDTIRFFVGASGAVILVASVTTSISGFSRLAQLGEHGQLPRAFGRLHRRTLVSPQAILSAALISGGLVIASAFIKHDVAFLASVFSFGVLLAFTATQLAVIKLRIAEPDLPRPYRTPLNVTIRGAELPVPALVGAVLTFAGRDRRGRDASGRPVRRARMACDRARRLRRRQALARRGADRAGGRAGPAALRRRAAVPPDPRPDEARTDRRGDGRDGAQARRRARRPRRGAARHPRSARAPVDAAMVEKEQRPAASLAEAHALGEARGVEVAGPPSGRARSGGRSSPRAEDRGRPDRARLVASLAEPVAVLLPDRRLRPPPRAGRSPRRRLPPERARRAARCHLASGRRR